MDRVALSTHCNKEDFTFLTLPKNTWTSILLLAVKSTEIFSCLSKTCHTLRTLAHQPAVIKSVFQESQTAKVLKTPLNAQKTLLFLEYYLSPKDSLGLILDFSKYRAGSLKEEDMRRILTSFPRLSQLNLCVEVQLFAFAGLSFMEKVLKGAPLTRKDGENLQLIVWDINNEKDVLHSFQSQHPNYTISFVSIPAASHFSCIHLEEVGIFS